MIRLRASSAAALMLVASAGVQAQNTGRPVISSDRIQVKVELRGSETDEQRGIVELGRAYLQRALNNERFQKRLRGSTLPGNNEKGVDLKASRFRHFNGRSESKCRGDVWSIIEQGRERTNAPTTNQPVPDRTLNIKMVLVPKKRPTVGSTTLGRNPVRTGYWFINAAAQRSDAVSVARHMMHEWLHIAGFYHYPNNSARGDVPYALGDLVREILSNRTVREAAETDPALTNDPVLAAMTTRALNLGEDPLLSELLDEVEDQVEIGDENYDVRESLVIDEVTGGLRQQTAPAIASCPEPS